MINSHYPRCVRLFWNENTKSRKSLKTEDHVSINETQAFGNPSAVWALRQAMRDMSWKVGSRWFEQFILGNRLWMFPKTGVPPKSSNLIGVFHYFHHPFWGKHPYFWKHPNRLVRRLLGWAAKGYPGLPLSTSCFLGSGTFAMSQSTFAVNFMIRFATRRPTWDKTSHGFFQKDPTAPVFFWDALAFGILVRLISTLEGHSKMYQWWYMQCYKKKF